jgi:hypothetical protein
MTENDVHKGPDPVKMCPISHPRRRFMSLSRFGTSLAVGWPTKCRLFSREAGYVDVD